MPDRKRVIIMGAAGRDFHNFNVCFRDDPEHEVVAFTAFQIPNIAGRTYPVELAGPLYPQGIPIHDEEDLPQLIRRFKVTEVVFAYSDVSHLHVMDRASRVVACGADFRLLGTAATTLESSRPVVSVCAVRTGCGKSQTSRCLARLLREQGKKVVVVRHPMPYGDLRAQIRQRYADLRDLDRYDCTIEEREEYEKHIRLGHIVYAGVDYQEILRAAEQEAEVILWDGGNNDFPFYQPDLHIVLADPHRPGHEIEYYPGEANLLLADVVLITKIGTATREGIDRVEQNVRRLNPEARIVRADSVVSVEDWERIRDRRVLAVEDGPTVTHGDMPIGAAHVAARKFGAAEIVDPRPHAVGSIAEAFNNYPHLKEVLPAMGYSDGQMQELKESIDRTPCDLVLVGTPIDLAGLLDCGKPLLQVTYELDNAAVGSLREIVKEFADRLDAAPAPS